MGFIERNFKTVMVILSVVFLVMCYKFLVTSPGRYQMGGANKLVVLDAATGILYLPVPLPESNQVSFVVIGQVPR